MVDSYTKQLEEKVASYVATVQPELEKLAEVRRNEREFVKRASHSVGVLVGLGLVAREDASKMIDKIASDHSQVFGILESLATDVRASRMGTTSNEKSADSNTDPSMQVWFDAFNNDD